MFSPLLRGRRLLELQKWRTLRVPVTHLQNASVFAESFSSASAADVKSEDDRKGKTFAVSYMVNSCGLTLELAESISRRVSFEDLDNLDAVLNLLRSHGFTDSQTCRIIRTYPRLLLANVEKSLRPKLEFLQSRGASSSELTEIISKVPRILGKRSNNSLSLYYDFLKDVLIHHDEVGKTSKDEEFHCSLAQGVQKNIVRNISDLRQLGVPWQLLSRLLISHPGSVCGKERFQESVKKVIEMGLDPTTSKFTDALLAVCNMSVKTIQQKVDVFKRWGYSESDIWAAFKKCPKFLKVSENKITQTYEALKRCGLVEDEVRTVFKKYPGCVSYSEQKIANSYEALLSLDFTRDESALIIKRHPMFFGLSADTVKEKTEFLVKMGWRLSAISSAPTVLGYSLQKRIFPRCNVIRALMSKGLIEEVPPISSVLTSPNNQFLNSYVVKHRKLVPELMDIFTGKSNPADQKLRKTRPTSTRTTSNVVGEGK